jgi:hypothetical protein
VDIPGHSEDHRRIRCHCADRVYVDVDYPVDSFCKRNDGTWNFIKPAIFDQLKVSCKMGPVNIRGQQF